jgi:hypothetical protein
MLLFFGNKQTQTIDLIDLLEVWSRSEHSGEHPCFKPVKVRLMGVAHRLIHRNCE